MKPFTVYLFVRTPPDGPTSAVALRRLQALQCLRDELLAIGGMSVAAAPDLAQLQVEITNVFAADDMPALRGTGRLTRDGRRVLIVRLAARDGRMDFVCADGVGRQSAEQQAARRISAWRDCLDRPPAGPAISTLPSELNARISTNC